MKTKQCKCKFCNSTFKSPNEYTCHIEKAHSELIVPGMSPSQSLYFLHTGKKEGRCIICGKPTTWNERTCIYNRFCDDSKCKDKYIEEFRKRMIGKYGKTTLLNDPEQQKIMLAHRSISGVYRWSDSLSETPYTGSYEYAFLEYLDIVMDYIADDVIAPSPHTYFYEYEGEKHFYIPDFFIPSLNLEIEIKDGGNNPNNHGKIQAVDKVKEKLKDQVMISNSKSFNYLKITNKNHRMFFDYLMIAKEQSLRGDTTPIIMIGE